MLVASSQPTNAQILEAITRLQCSMDGRLSEINNRLTVVEESTSRISPLEASVSELAGRVADLESRRVDSDQVMDAASFTSSRPASSAVGDTGATRGNAMPPPTAMAAPASHIPDTLIIGGFVRSPNETIRERCNRFMEKIPSHLRQFYKYSFANGLQDSKGYVRLRDGTPAETAWEIIKAVKDNNTEFSGDDRVFWITRAKSPQLVAKTSRLRDLAVAMRALRPLQGGGSYAVCSKKCRLLVLPEGDSIARIPHGQTSVLLNTSLLASWGITPNELETKATDLASSRQWL